jgi:predicted dinucleotide-binding enzyme
VTNRTRLRCGKELGELASATSVEKAITDADVVVFAVWLDTLKDLIAEHADLLKGKVVIDPSTPIAQDANGGFVRTLPDGQSSGSVVAVLLPAEAHFVKAFGTLGAESLASEANRPPARCCSTRPMTTRLLPRSSRSSRQPGLTR